MATIGRPSLFTPEIGDMIADLYSEGVRLEDICDEYDWAPERASTIRNWAEDIPAFSEKFARAHRRHADALAGSTLVVLDKERDPSRARVAIQAMQWLAGKYANNVYGEKLEITADHKVSLVDAIEAGQGRLLPMRDQHNASNSQGIDMIDITPVRSTDVVSGGVDAAPLPDWFD